MDVYREHRQQGDLFSETHRLFAYNIYIYIYISLEYIVLDIRSLHLS